MHSGLHYNINVKLIVYIRIHEYNIINLNLMFMETGAMLDGRHKYMSIHNIHTLVLVYMKSMIILYVIIYW